jgi:beta-lactamase class D
MRQLNVIFGIALLSFGLTHCSIPNESKDQAKDAVPSSISDAVHLGLPMSNGALIQNKLGGSLHLFDEENKIYYHTDSAGFYKKNVPASTFKIFTSLIAIEKGLLKDQHEVKAWRNRTQQNKDWNKDQDLKEAFAQSTNWFFEDLTTAIGTDTLNTWLKRIGYPVYIQQGEKKFWLDENFAVTPQEQLILMQNLKQRIWPFSQRTFDVISDIMVRKDTLGIKIYGKTGWGTPHNTNVGWYIGWATFENRKPIYFATCIEQTEPADPQFDRWRKDLTEIALKEAYPQGWNQLHLSEKK